MLTLSHRSKRTPFRKNVLNEILSKSNLNRTTWPPGSWDQELEIFRKSEAKFRLIHLIAAVTVYLPAWHWHCTGASFIVLVSWNGEIAVCSHPLLWVPRQVAELANGLFYGCSLLRNNNTAINLQTFTSSYRSRRFSVCD